MRSCGRFILSSMALAEIRTVATARRMARRGRGLVGRIAPGVCASLAVAGVAEGLQVIEVAIFGRSWLEALVLAIVVGAVVRLYWTPRDRWISGIAFSAKFLLELAIVLLGATISAASLLAIGPGLLVGIIAVVVCALAAGWIIGRLLGLSPRMTILVACGNAICGNSAIAAVAPVIGADGDEVTAAIGFTAALGVGVVVGLPFLGVALHMSALQFGALAGLTVYAVPQVVAAAAPMGAVAIQFGALVKLVRVLMLGPVCLALALVLRGRGSQPDVSVSWLSRVTSVVPWFIVGFLILVALRSCGLASDGLAAPLSSAALWLTVVAMAALGLSTDLRLVAKSGPQISFAVCLCAVTLAALSLLLIRLMHLS